jgi:hypothetical protein
MSELTPRGHALRVAVLGAVLDTVKAEYSKARSAAQAAFAPIRADGQKQQEALLPDGTGVGLISIKEGATSVEVTGEAELEAWVREHVPDGIEVVVTATALTDLDVLEMLAACFPGSVTERVRPSVRAALLAEMADNDGKVADKHSGEVALLGKVTRHKPTGEFSYRPDKRARDRIVGDWRAGRLTEVVFGPLPLSAGPQVVAEPEPEAEPEAGAMQGFGVFGDDLGLYDPVAAARYAIVMSNGAGFTTPPIEAYRMIRDGGIHAERALAWLAEEGLPRTDPREGKDVPWPLVKAEECP